MRTGVLSPADVPLRQYEVDLVRWQLARMGYDADLQDRDAWTVHLNGTPSNRALRELLRVTFVDRVSIDGSSSESLYAVLESDGDGDRRRSRVAAHRYLVHGIHQYRGKYYPQIARSLIVGSRAPSDSVILDPFVGSGTTLIEASVLGYKSVGIDLSPMATFLARVKTQLLTTPVDRFADDLARAVKNLRLHASSCSRQHSHVARSPYLASWLDPQAARRIDCALEVISATRHPLAADVLRVHLSRRMRAWSMQEPEDMRVRRRQRPPDTANALDDLAGGAEDTLAGLVVYAGLLAEHRLAEAKVFLADGRMPAWPTGAHLRQGSVGAIVTSPPYATALPYIDTDRLSILALRLVGDHEWRALDGALIGSREITTSDRRTFERLIPEANDLPLDVREYLESLASAVNAAGDRIGFRRRNMPALLARYFTGMDACVRTWPKICRRGALIALVVGDSRTNIDGTWWDIPTRRLLASLLAARGFTAVGEQELTDQPAYNRHSANAIKAESILLHEFAGDPYR